MKHKTTIFRFVLAMLLAGGIPLCGFANDNAPLAETQSQEVRTIRGTALDHQGQPAVGALVQVKGTSKTAFTDVNGSFAIKIAPDDRAITITLLGMKTAEIVILSGKDSYEITMDEDVMKLDDVVVVGYGTQRKATLTGSVASVKGADIKAAGSKNVSNAFAGRLPGVIAVNRSGEPGNDYSSLLIRGKGTLNDNSPLIVIDGVANRSGMERINPSDIESISVLKDASAAIYGAQAANGVILITTKKGVMSKPTVEYNGTMSLSQFTRTPELLNAYEYMNYDDEIKTHMKQQPIFTNIKNGYLDGTINRKKYGDTDWMNAIFSDYAPETRHSLAVRGGSENTRYYVSGDFTYQEPNYRSTAYNFQTNQVRVNIEQEVTPNITLGVNASGRNELRNTFPSSISTGTVFWETFMVYPYLYDYYPNGLPGPGISWGNNLSVLTQGREVGYGKVEDFFLDSKFDFKIKLPGITEGLSIDGFAAFDQRFRNYKSFNDVWDTYRYNDDTDDYDKQTTNNASNNRTLLQSNTKNISTTLNARINYDRQFGDHHVSGFVAYEQNKIKGEYFEAWRGYYLSNQIDYLNQGGDKDKTNGGYGTIAARQNIFGRLNYDYLSKYMIEFTMRYDGSMNFPTDSRWGAFPGVSAGWRISEEKFMEGASSWLGDLKLRASWGKLGNDRVENFQYLDTFLQGNGALLGDSPVMSQAFRPGRIGNPSITWEKVDTKNIAIEGQLRNGLLSFSAEYFLQNRKDILTKKQASIPNYTGLTLPDQNIGEVDNSGFEISLNHDNRIGDWRYYAGANFTYTKNKIIFFDEAASTPDWQRRTGYPIDSWMMYKTDGIYQTQAEIDNSPHFAGARPGDIRYLDIDDDGQITSKDQVRDYISNIPRIVYGITMGAEWKGLALNVLWSGQAMVKQMIIPYQYNPYRFLYDDRWISATETPNAKYPRAFNKDDGMNTRYSDFWFYDASFIRLKNVELAYTIPKNISQKLGMQYIRVYLLGNNLFSIDKIGFQDPEASNVNAGQYYPQVRTYTFGLNISF